MVWEVSDSVEEVTDGPFDHNKLGGREYEVCILRCNHALSLMLG